MFVDLVRESRSCRSFTGRQVTREELERLVAVARMTPSASNRQPLKYYLAATPEDCRRIQPLTVWAAALPRLGLPREGHRPTGFVVICHDSEILPDAAAGQRDVGIVAQTILLAAREMGLGGCMIGNFSPKRLQEALQLPETLIPQLVLGLGEPEETVVLTVAKAGETGYYRDEGDVHYVPKRPLDALIINN